MQLLELTPAELAFLAAEPGAATDFQRRMGQRLAYALIARLRMATQVQPDATSAGIETCTAPVWQPDGVLATLWLTRRLGGGRVLGQASFVPRTLIEMLNETLAECWIEQPTRNETTRAYAWAVSAGPVQARLELLLPDQLKDMAHWARGVMQRV